MKMLLTPREFQNIVYQHYSLNGRHSLPWRQTEDPYRILVSEIMLQQTQVERVIPFYERFLARFPDVKSLSEASLGDVLRLWQGLGYNRRAKLLHECARTIVREWGGVFPVEQGGLQTLPGVGPYTAGAVMAFAYNTGVTMIETNIRTVFIHHFFSDARGVHDKEILPLIDTMMDKKNPRRWYAALMDYGSHLKRTIGNVSRKSAHHTTQKTFKGSDRQIRGAIIRTLSEYKWCTVEKLTKISGYKKPRIKTQLDALHDEGMVMRERNRYRLP
jgi:A/G-specific adenine glycosylase